MRVLSSRERVDKAINHEEPDRVPSDLSLTTDSYLNLVKFLGMEKYVKVDRSFTNWLTYADLDYKVMRALDVDVVQLASRPQTGFPKWLDDGSFIDDWGIRRAPVTRDGGSFYFEVVEEAIKTRSLKALEDHDWPDPTDQSIYDDFEEKLNWWRERTDLAILAWFDRGGLGEHAGYLRGLANWCQDLIVDPEFASALLDKLADISLGYNLRGVKRFGKYINILAFGWDLGTQQNLLFSPKMCHEIFQPIMRKVWLRVNEELKKVNPRAKIFLHSCGAIYPIIPLLIENGIEILDPIQTSAKGIETKKLKDTFGDKLSFHGAIDIQQFLPRASVPEVWAEVERVIKDLAPGGGYIMCSGHAIQEDVPPANVLAMYQASKTLGAYPLG